MTRRTSATPTPTSPSTCSTACGAIAGCEVNHVQNVTDIDDPLLERAAETGIDWAALAEQQTQLFGEDMAALNVLPPRHYVGAVESMPLIVDLIEQLRRTPSRLSSGRQRVRGPVLRAGE